MLAPLAINCFTVSVLPFLDARMSAESPLCMKVIVCGNTGCKVKSVVRDTCTIHVLFSEATITLKMSLLFQVPAQFYNFVICDHN